MVMIIRLIFLMLIMVPLPSLAGEKIDAIGKILYSKETSSFYFFFLKDDKVVSYVISQDNKNVNEKLKALKNKSVRIIGESNWKIKRSEHFSAKEILTISQLTEFELNVLSFNPRKMLEQDNLISHYKSKRKIIKAINTFEIPDAAANTLIGAAAAVMGVLSGPIVLIPAAVYSVSQLVQ